MLFITFSASPDVIVQGNYDYPAGFLIPQSKCHFLILPKCQKVLEDGG